MDELEKSYLELAEYLDLSVQQIMEIPITYNSANVYEFKDTKEGVENLYKDFSRVTPEFLKLLLWTSNTQRPKDILSFLKKTKDKKCLDFGSGVGTHSLILAENHNEVVSVDLEGPLQDFFKFRAKSRGLDINFFNIVPELKEYFDVLVCLDVLEHIYSPFDCFIELVYTLKIGGYLLLEIGEMTNDKMGHFCYINKQIKDKLWNYIDKYYTKEKEGIYVKRW